MMKKALYLSYSLLIASFLVTGQVKMERNYDESFSAMEGNKVEVNNKYGEVIIRTWSDSNVRIVGKIIAQGRNQEVVNKTMKRGGQQDNETRRSRHAKDRPIDNRRYRN